MTTGIFSGLILRFRPPRSAQSRSTLLLRRTWSSGACFGRCHSAARRVRPARMTLVRRSLVGLLVVAAAIAGAAPIASFAADQKEREFQECSECPVMVGIPDGNLTWGSRRRGRGLFDQGS